LSYAAIFFAFASAKILSFFEISNIKYQKEIYFQ